MNTVDHIKRLSKYPNSIDYENSIIEKEFIVEVVSEKLKVVADTSSIPLVSLYAIYKTDFQSDYIENPVFYENYLSKWEKENSSYFKSFRQKFPTRESSFKTNKISLYIIFLAGAVIIGKGVYNLFYPQNIHSVDVGMVLVATAGLVNFGLSTWLEKTGKRNQSMVLTADGKHLRADAWSSLGLLVGLGLFYFTQIKFSR